MSSCALAEARKEKLGLDIFQLRDKVRETFDREALKRICALEPRDFAAFGDLHEVTNLKDDWPNDDRGPDETTLEELLSDLDEPTLEDLVKRFPGCTADEERADIDDFYIYKDNGSDILAIAHLDTVQDASGCVIADTPGGPIVFSPRLDDRLGAYVILDLLPKLGVKVDWLLTVGEENCNSTAQHFVADKVYNWMFQFDRAGTDVVMYEYETKRLRRLLHKVGFQPGHGTLSDICYLDHLGCSGFNFGVGYQDYHSTRSHAWLNDTFTQVARFLKFYARNKTARLKYDRNAAPHGKEADFLPWKKSDVLDDDDDAYIPYGFREGRDTRTSWRSTVYGGKRGHNYEEES